MRNVKRAAGALIALFVLAGAVSAPARAVFGLPQILWVNVRSQRTLTQLPGFLSVTANLPDQRLADGQIVVQPTQPGRYEAVIKVFGVLPVRTVTVQALPPISAVPGGQAIGVLLDTAGVLVVGDAASPAIAARAGLRAGDLITAADGQPVRSKEQLAAIIQAAGQKGRSLTLTVRRLGGTSTLRVLPAPEGSRYLIGAWVRDGISGIGTLTFYDPAADVFAALGHVVADAATGAPYPLESGRIVPALVSGLSPGRQGAPGEKIGLFSANASTLGVIAANTSLGVFGRLVQTPVGGISTRAVPIALEDQIRTGPAEMLTVIAGTRVQPFAIDIVRVVPQGRPEAKGLVVQVTDPRLLQATGGIVQGMSGSPILQDGRLIGAVTHVFVNDPTRGYGVLAIWMAEGAGLLHSGG